MSTVALSLVLIAIGITFFYGFNQLTTIED